MAKFDLSGVITKSVLLIGTIIVLGCTQEQPSYESTLQSHHLKVSQQDQTDNTLRVLVTKPLNANFEGVFYKFESSNKYYFAIVEDKEKVINVIDLKGQESVSLFRNKRCFVLFNKSTSAIIPEESEYCFSLFLGKIPYEGYTDIQLEWNCSKDLGEREQLIDGKYFFFIKESLDNQVCNLTLINSSGKAERLAYNQSTGLFGK